MTVKLNDLVVLTIPATMAHVVLRRLRYQALAYDADGIVVGQFYDLLEAAVEAHTRTAMQVQL